MGRTKAPDERHESRWQRHRAGMSPEEIATEDKVSVDTVKGSIRSVELRRSMFTRDEMEVSQVEVIRHVAGLEKAALSDALTATKKVKNPDTQVVESVPDHDVRLRAVGSVTEKVAALQPKGRGTLVQVGVNAGPGSNPSVGIGGARSVGFEDILRKIHAQREAPQLPSGDMATVEGEIVVDSPEAVAVEN